VNALCIRKKRSLARERGCVETLQDASGAVSRKVPLSLPLDEAKTPPARLRYPFVRQLKRVVSFNGRAMREVWGELGWSFTPNYPHPA
jgi:hypothetical protein